MNVLLQNNIIVLGMLVLVASVFSQGDLIGQTVPVYPFVRVSEGLALPFVEGVQQQLSPYWDIGAGLSYENLTVGASIRSHFLASEADTLLDAGIELATEGHTAIFVAHVEGKADIAHLRFAASIDLGLIWFHEFDHIRGSRTHSKLPVVGLGLDFRIPVSGKTALDLGVGYMAAFEGFEVNAKAYNSVHACIGLAYDGGWLY